MAIGPEQITRPVDGQEVSAEIRDTADVIEGTFDSTIKEENNDRLFKTSNR